MSNVAAAILSLTDNMSPKLLKCGRNWDNLSKAEQRAANASMATVHTWVKQIDKVTTRVLQFGAALAAAATIAGLKTGFAEAFDLETYRMQLETATKDTKRAAEIMTYAVKLANATPFEGGELVAASAALEMAGLKSETYLRILGDTAAGANKEISVIQAQFVKAFATGTTGEFFDMINVSRQAFADFAKANGYATTSLSDTQAALQKFLNQQFGGGMANLAKTVKGAWSTVTGTAKSALSQVVGMGIDGAIRTGSMLDRLSGKLQGIASNLDKWTEDGTIDKWATRVGGAFETAWTWGEKLFNFIEKHGRAIATTAGILIFVKLISNTIQGVATLIKNVNTLKTAFISLGKVFGIGKAATAAASAAGAASTTGAGVATATGAVGAAGAGIAPVLGALGVYGAGAAITAIGAYATYKSDIEPRQKSWEAFKRGDYLSADTISDAKKVNLITGAVEDVSESDYVKSNTGDFFTDMKANSGKFPTVTNNIDITVNGANKTDDELANEIANEIVRVLDNK